MDNLSRKQLSLTIVTDARENDYGRFKAADFNVGAAASEGLQIVDLKLGGGNNNVLEFIVEGNAEAAEEFAERFDCVEYQIKDLRNPLLIPLSGAKGNDWG